MEETLPSFEPNSKNGQCEETRIIFHCMRHTWYLNSAWCHRCILMVVSLQIHHQNRLHLYFHGLRMSSLHLWNATEPSGKLLMMAHSPPSLTLSPNFDGSFYKMQPCYQRNTATFLFSALRHSIHPDFGSSHQILQPSSNPNWEKCVYA